jgi:hypothetical protein
MIDPALFCLDQPWQSSSLNFDTYDFRFRHGLLLVDLSFLSGVANPLQPQFLLFFGRASYPPLFRILA